ncbi:MAG: ATP phosphoribosyltransferase regulatory subunit, partial [Thalassovita sp.]
YAGEVFRRQEDDAARPNEYLQVGYEVFDRDNPIDSDAEVFTVIRAALGDVPLRAATGDIGILMAAVDGLRTTEARKSALRRHIWHPRRFRSLIDRYAGRTPVPASRQALLAAADPFADNVPQIGLRSRAEVIARIETLRADAAAAPLSEQEVALLDAILSVRESLPNALEHLRDIAVDLPAIDPAVERLAKRMKALEKRGVDVDTLDFEASYGRTSLEYYDGFVFGFYEAARPDLPPVAAGGRYDAL